MCRSCMRQCRFPLGVGRVISTAYQSFTTSTTVPTSSGLLFSFQDVFPILFQVEGRPQDFSLGWGGKTEGLKAEIGGEVLGEGAATPSPPARGSGERCEFRSGVRSRAGADDVRQSPDCPKVFHYFQHSGWPLLTL